MANVYTIRFKNIGIKNFEFVSKTQFLCKTLNANISIFHESIILSNLSKKVSHMHPPFRRKVGAPYPLHPSPGYGPAFLQHKNILTCLYMNIYIFRSVYPSILYKYYTLYFGVRQLQSPSTKHFNYTIQNIRSVLNLQPCFNWHQKISVLNLQPWFNWYQKISVSNK